MQGAGRLECIQPFFSFAFNKHSLKGSNVRDRVTSLEACVGGGGGESDFEGQDLGGGDER